MNFWKLPGEGIPGAMAFSQPPSCSPHLAESISSSTADSRGLERPEHRQPAGHRGDAERTPRLRDILGGTLKLSPINLNNAKGLQALWLPCQRPHPCPVSHYSVQTTRAPFPSGAGV